MSTFLRLLRDPHALLDEFDHADGPAKVAPPLLGIALLGAAIAGATVGSWHGGTQVALAALKVPLLVLLPVLFTLPAVHTINSACSVALSYRRLALASLIGAARTGALMATGAPLLWFIVHLDIRYHTAVLVLASTTAAAGLPGITFVVSSAPAGGFSRRPAALLSIALLALVWAQCGWMLRPFLVRDGATVTFLRPMEEDVVSALIQTTRRWVGDEREWSVAPGGVVGRRTAPQQMDRSAP